VSAEVQLIGIEGADAVHLAGQPLPPNSSLSAQGSEDSPSEPVLSVRLPRAPNNVTS